MSKEFQFKGTVLTQRFSSDTYKIYTISVNRKVYPNLQSNKNNEFVIVGNLPTLIPNVEYDIVATVEINKNFGIQYKVKNCRRDKPTDVDSARSFLEEVLTESQAKTLLSVYPNIVDKVIKNDLDDINLDLLFKIGEATFDKIKKKIIENFCLIDLVDKFGGLIDMSIIKKLYDQYTNVKVIEVQLKRDPYRCLCELSRVGFKTADSILLNIQELNRKNPDKYKFNFDYELKFSPQRMKSCLVHILEENEKRGNTKMTLKEARQECGKLVPECIDLFVTTIKESNKDIHVDIENKLISTKTAYDTEIEIANFVKNINKKPIRWNINTEIYREIENMSMTDEQLSTLDVMCESNIAILTAPAGSGKSASVKALLNMLEDNDLTYRLMTPTGASSKVLEDYVNRKTGTIHRQLEYNPSKETIWGYNKDNKIKEDVVVVDEFSMTDIYLFKHIIDAIDINKTKLLMVFDPYQLPSVSCGNIAQDLLSSKVVPTVFLTKIFRYAEGGLMQVATSVRNGEKFLPNNFKGNKVFGTKKDFIYSELEQESIPKQVLKIYKKLLDDGYSPQDIMVLSSQNKGDYGTKSINKTIQQMIQRECKTNFVMRGDVKFHKNDKVIQIVNNYKAKKPDNNETQIFNGNTGIITEIRFNELISDFDDDNIKYEKEDLNQIELGYSITTHKSQGASAKQVIVICPKAHTFMMNSNLLYVAFTRAKERVYCVGNINTINSAIKKKENLNRSTWLQQLLKTN